MARHYITDDILAISVIHSPHDSFSRSVDRKAYNAWKSLPFGIKNVYRFMYGRIETYRDYNGNCVSVYQYKTE